MEQQEIQNSEVWYFLQYKKENLQKKTCKNCKQWPIVLQQ